MIKLRFSKQSPLKILALGAHCDDIEIGCGGTLLKLLDEYPAAEIFWVVFSSNPTRKKEAEYSAQDYLQNHKSAMIEINSFRNGYFPYVATDIKEYFETIKAKFNPDIIFTHYSDDKHQDHRTIAELSWNTFRDNVIFQYEIAKYDGDLCTPNFYTTLSEKYVEKKIDLLLKHYKTQTDKHWFTRDLFKSLLRVRGVECVSDSGFAEGFHARKLSF
jgi:LmbE family N-acetylglucosaminyl deacetylase